MKRGLGVPSLFAAAYSAVGFSIYFALGVVAERGLGLTPLIFLAAGLLFGLTTLSYVEGGAMFRERGGSSAFARHALHEPVGLIAVVAMLAYAGIEAASDLAPDIEVSKRDLKRVASLGAIAVPVVYAGMAAIALMAVPVVAGPHGPETALGTTYINDPVLGVVSSF